MTTRRTRVLIESPFGTNADGSKCTAYEYKRNEEYVLKAIDDSLSRGEAPFASHALYPLVLDDTDKKERRAGMESGFAWGDAADMVAVYIDYGITKGMQEGIERWESLGKKIDFRVLHLKETAI